MKKFLVLLLTIVFIVLVGVFIYSYSVFNEEKNVNFKLAVKICEENIEYANRIEKNMEHLEKYAESNSGELNPYYVNGLKEIKSDIEKSYEKDSEYLYELLKDYTHISEANTKVALESYVTAEDYLFKAYVTLAILNDDEDYLGKYSGFIKDAKKELEFGRSYFENYLDKLKNQSLIENLKMFIKRK